MAPSYSSDDDDDDEELYEPPAEILKAPIQPRRNAARATRSIAVSEKDAAVVTGLKKTKTVKQEKARPVKKKDVFTPLVPPPKAPKPKPKPVVEKRRRVKLVKLEDGNPPAVVAAVVAAVAAAADVPVPVVVATLPGLVATIEETRQENARLTTEMETLLKNQANQNALATASAASAQRRVLEAFSATEYQKAKEAQRKGLENDTKKRNEYRDEYNRMAMMLDTNYANMLGQIDDDPHEPVVEPQPEPEPDLALHLPQPFIPIPTDIESTLLQINTLLPDCESSFARNLLTTKVIIDGSKEISVDEAVARTIELLFEVEGGYPKCAVVGKRKKRDWDTSNDDDGANTNGNTNTNSQASGSRKRININGHGAPVRFEDENDAMEYRNEEYLKERRKGTVYSRLALDWLERTFVDMTLVYIKSIFLKNSSLYVPTHYDLHSQQQLLPLDQRPYRPLKIPRNPKPEKKAKTKTAKVKTRVATGTNRARVKKVAQLDEDGFPLNVEELFADLENDDFMEDDGDKDEEKEDDKGEGAFLMEKDWLLKDLKNTGTVKSLEMVKRLDPPVGEGSMECGCCFGDEHLEYMVRCQDGHFFCAECMTRLIDNALGEQRAPVTCMDGSDCHAKFLDSQLRRAIEPKTLSNYHNLLQRKELEAAGIEGLESCPSCNYAVVMENEHEKLFTCEMEDCGLISCRGCKKPDHIPRTCAEAAADGKLDQRHAVEEAMTQALVRNCPGCNKPFMKEGGCNKMTCMNCHTISCYICRKAITNGYNHFDQNASSHLLPKQASKCSLWDSKETTDIHQVDIVAARQAAQERAVADAAELRIEINQEDIDVELPNAGRGLEPARAVPLLPVPFFPVPLIPAIPPILPYPGYPFGAGGIFGNPRAADRPY